MPGIDDVARLAGVSKATASRALSGRGSVAERTRERVLGAAAKLDYRASPAAVKLATGRSGAIGVLAPEIDSWYVATLLRGIADRALEHDLDIVIYHLGRAGERRERVFERFLHQHHVDALISTTFALAAHETDRLASLGIPAAALGDPAPGIRTWCLDDERVGVVATEHLLGLGHERVVHVGGRSLHGLALFAAEQHRERGYLSAMRAAGLPVPETVRLHPTTVEAHRAALSVLADDPPPAIFAATDEIAMGVCIAAMQLGIRIPEQLSIVGCDDHPFAAAFGLTTIQQDPAAHGAEVVRWIVDELDHPSGDVSHTEIEPQLLLRTSTGPAT